MPTYHEAANAASSCGASTSSKKSFWNHELLYAGPNPSQLEGGWQYDRAPMCPCLTCWESGSPYHVSRPKKPKKPKTPKPPMSDTSSISSSASSFLKKSPLRFLRRRCSRESVASSEFSALKPSATAVTTGSTGSTETAVSHAPSVLEKDY